MTSLSHFPDWESIGRRIGKRLKDILRPPTEDHGPSREERQARRVRDAHRGFTYFDSVDEVEDWGVRDIDPVQQANTPLLKRPVLEQSVHKSKLLLCHDYAGNYHDYESSVRPSTVESELYSCQYLQFVDTFVYFSHKLVCLPPPTWTNTLHRNGVKVLGTFVLEPQSPVERLFTKLDGRYLIAEQLARMASAYNFEGYLLNFEKEFETNFIEDILGFIKQLKKGLGDDRMVIWYDSLDVHNSLNYQNGLTARNLDFSLAADSLFTNYKWAIEKLNKSKELAQINQIATSNIFFGLDTWAQNTNMPGPPRITYPPDSGGGTSLGLGAATLAKNGFSTAVFGPAWVYEHFSADISPSVDQSVWEGATLPKELGCDCKKGRPHHTASYQLNPITASAQDYPAGSATFFDSDFEQAFQHISSANEHYILPTLGSQAPRPNLLPMSANEWERIGDGPESRYLYGKLGISDVETFVQRTSCVQIFTQVTGLKTASGAETTCLNDYLSLSPKFTHRLCLFRLAIDAEDTYLVTVNFNRTRQGRSASVGLYLAYNRATPGVSELRYEDRDLGYNVSTANITTRARSGDFQLREVGVYCKGNFDSSEPSLLVEIARLVIRKKPLSESADHDFGLQNITIQDWGNGSHKHQRLMWKWRGSRSQWPIELPWSDITGPFSHFTVLSDKRVLGIAHCLEFPLLKEDFPSASEIGNFNVIGHSFGGVFTITGTLSVEQQAG